MTFPLYANHETSLGFFLGDTAIKIKNHNIINETKSSKVFLFGLSTSYKGTMTSQGNYHTFTIEFKPNGFNKLFGIPASKICNSTFPANEVIGNAAGHFYEQLLHASGIQEMTLFADIFLIGFLNKKKGIYMNDGITQIFQPSSIKQTTTHIRLI